PPRVRRCWRRSAATRARSCWSPTTRVPCARSIRTASCCCPTATRTCGPTTTPSWSSWPEPLTARAPSPSGDGALTRVVGSADLLRDDRGHDVELAGTGARAARVVAEAVQRDGGLLVELDHAERRALGLALVRGHAGEGRGDGTGVDAPFLGLRLVLDAESRLQLRGRRHGRALVVVEDRVHLDQVRAGREGELADLGRVRLERAADLLDRRALEGVGEGELGARAV